MGVDGQECVQVNAKVKNETGCKSEDEDEQTQDIDQETLKKIKEGEYPNPPPEAYETDPWRNAS